MRAVGELFYGTMNFQKMQKPRRVQGRLPSEKADTPNTSARRLPCRRPANRMIDDLTDDDVPEDCGFSYYVGRSVGSGLLIAFAFGAIVLVFLAFKAMLWVLAW